MLDPDQVAVDEAAAENLRALAALAGTYWDALRSQVPESAAVQMLIDWHYEVITGGGVEWEDDSE